MYNYVDKQLNTRIDIHRLPKKLNKKDQQKTPYTITVMDGYRPKNIF
jgi:hypothetical protein